MKVNLHWYDWVVAHADLGRVEWPSSRARYCTRGPVRTYLPLPRLSCCFCVLAGTHNRALLEERDALDRGDVRGWEG